MGWIDSTFETEDTVYGMPPSARIDESQETITERSTLQLFKKDTEALDTDGLPDGSVIGTAIVAPIKRTRTMTRFKWVGLTEAYAKASETRLAGDTTGLGISNVRAQRMNDANAWIVEAVTDSYTSWSAG